MVKMCTVLKLKKKKNTLEVTIDNFGIQHSKIKLKGFPMRS